MNEKWKKAFGGAKAVQAFDTLDRGGSQLTDPRYDTPGRVAPPSEDPPQHVQYQISQYGQNASYFNGHPQSTVSPPFAANTVQPPGPYQHSYQSAPPQQGSPPGLNYNHTPNPSTYGAHNGTTTISNFSTTGQGFPSRMGYQNATGHPPRQQDRAFNIGNGANSANWRSADTPYDPYNQPRVDYSQRSNTMHQENYQKHYDSTPVPLYRSFTEPNNYDHNCSDHRSQYDGTCVVCKPPYYPS
ncbi:hypothetical protein PMIN03_006005 [Paraphaeosphaeria minitans]